MCCVHIKAVSKGESDGVMKCRISGTIVCFNRRLSETRHKLLHIANSLCPGYRWAPSYTVPIYIYFNQNSIRGGKWRRERTNSEYRIWLRSAACKLQRRGFLRIIKSFPLLLREEFTELGITKSDRLVGAQFLHGINISNAQFKPINISLQTRDGILEIHCIPCISKWCAAVADTWNVIIGARSIRGESIVNLTCSYYQSSILE